MLPLKEATAEKHKLAERMPFNGRMYTGKLTDDEISIGNLYHIGT
jgi:hypothetical protein